MRGDHWELGGELALQDLEVRVAEPRGVDADEELVVFDLRYWAMLQLVWIIILVRCQPHS